MPRSVRLTIVTLAATELLLGTARRPVSAQEPGGPHLAIPHVLERGSDGPTLLLIPCAGCGAPSWTRFMDVNEDRFRMLAVTLPGYDGSPRPELPLWTDSTVFQDNALEQLSRLIDERSLDDVVAVGQSFGSLMALRLATRRPDAVRAVVNVDGSPTNPVEWADEPREALIARAHETVDDDWALRLQDPETYRSFNGATTQPDEAQRKLHHGMFMASDRVSMLHYWRENLLRDRNPEFRALDVPYLDIKAVSPRSPNPDSAAVAYAARIDEVGTPDDYTRVYAWDTSHWVHLEHPRTLGSVILRHRENLPIHDIGPFRFGEVLRRGTGDRDLLLMSCLGCDATSWNEFMIRNESHYRMIAVTWPGMGSTELPTLNDAEDGTPYFDHLMRSLELLIAREQLDRPVIVGHSAAAVAAIAFASRRPDLLSGVVNVDAIVANGETRGFDEDQRRAWADEEMRAVREQYDSDEAWAALNADPNSMSPDRAAFYGRMWRTPPRQNVLAWWRDWLRTDVGVLLPNLEVPFLAVHALSSDPVHAQSKVADLEGRYRQAPLPAGARVVFVEDAGHTIWEYQPEVFDQVIAEFVLGSIER